MSILSTIDYDGADPPESPGAPTDVTFTDSKFILANSSPHWIHGQKPPISMFKYYHSKRMVDRINMGASPGSFFKPVSVLEPLDHSSTNCEPYHEAVSSDVSDSGTMDLLYSTQDSTHTFSGYYTIPRISLTAPAKDSNSSNFNHMTSYVYHNHISIDEVVYVFGGLQCNKKCAFSDLGLPDNVDPAKVSVHLPVDLPPHIDRTILSSPYLEQNKSFIRFNPHGGIVTLLNQLVSNLPSGLNSVSYTKISPRHVFVFGGFQLVIKSVEHRQDLDRWIVEKEIVLNEDGYVLDIKTLTFTKIALKKFSDKDNVTDTDFQIGRLGTAIAGNIYNKVVMEDTISSFRPPTPSNFVDSTHLSPYIPVNDNSNRSATGSPTWKPKSTTNKINKSQTNDSNATSTSSPPNPSKTITNSSTDSISNTTSFLLKKSKSHSSKESRKGTNTLAKAFDRMNVLSSNGQTNPQNHETNPPMSMASTYSNHMKSHRSNSGSMKSRPVSPSPQSPMMSPKPISLFRAENSKPMTFTADEISMDDGLEPKSPSEVDESKSEKHPSSPNDLFGNTFVKPGASLTSIFIFGGFILVDNGTSKAFEATNDFLRIDLVCDGDFVSTNMDPEAIIYKVKLEDPSNTPNASGYCASTLIEHNLEEEENCQWNTIVRPWSPGSIFDDEASSSTSMQTSNSRHPSKLVKITTPEEFYEKKALLIQGGCNHNNETFSDMYLFKFASRQWEKLDTFCFNHFDNNIQPYDDDPSENLTKDKQIDKPDLIEAELRASHHTALYYNKLGREFVFFVGGFTNHYLRNYDPKPYHSDKFDVSRLARVRTTTTNQEICRLLVYNTKTQTWGFYKYYYDIRKNVSQQSFELLQHLRELVNANMYHHGAGVSLDGKSITICHGLVTPVTEKKADFEALDSQFPGPSMILGAHIQITFPSL